MKISSFILTFSLALSSSFVSAATPSDQSIQQLFKVMNIEKITLETIQHIKPQIAEQADQMVKMVVKHDKLSDKEQKVSNQIADQMYKQTLTFISWKELQPIYTQVYKETYTQEEVQAQIDFYSTPTGQSILNKTPIVTQKTMVMMNGRIQQAMLDQSSNLKTLFKQLDELKRTDSK